MSHYIRWNRSVRDIGGIRVGTKPGRSLDKFRHRLDLVSDLDSELLNRNKKRKLMNYPENLISQINLMKKWLMLLWNYESVNCKILVSLNPVPMRSID